MLDLNRPNFVCVPLAPGPQKELDVMRSVRGWISDSVAESSDVRMLAMTMIEALVQAEEATVLFCNPPNEESKHLFKGKVDGFRNPGFSLCEGPLFLREKDGLDDGVLVLKILVDRSDAHARHVGDVIRR